MPQVGNRKFAYTAAGIRQAMKAAKNMKRRPTSGRPLPRPRPGTMRPNFPGQPKERRQSIRRDRDQGGIVNALGGSVEQFQERRRNAMERPNLMRRPRPRPTSSMSSPQGQMNGIEALQGLSQQFGGGQGINIGGGPYNAPAPPTGRPSNPYGRPIPDRTQPGMVEQGQRPIKGPGIPNNRFPRPRPIKGPGIPNNRFPRPRPIKGPGIPNIRFPRV